MAQSMEDRRRRHGRGWRIAGWSMAAFLLLLPLLAMQVTDEVRWDETDFLVFGVMLAVAGGMFELGARMSGNTAYRIGMAIAIGAAFLLVWVNLAVGFLGNEDNPANLMFAGVIAIAVLGGFVAGFRPAGMARAMQVTAGAQVAVGLAGLVEGLGSPGVAGIYEVTMGSALFGTLWLLAAWQFGRAARALWQSSRTH